MEALRQSSEAAGAGAVASAGGRRPQRTLAPGTVLEDRYEIQRVLGRGGMSTVYQARDLRFGQVERLCAVKEMFDVDPDTRVRAVRLVNFEREAALLATLSHPAIPRIYDYFSQGGLVYLVLEHVDGHDLERLLAMRKAPFEEEEIIRLAMEVGDVLTMLHAHQPDPIIFRDLKPSNIMLRESGRVTLIDFGIARTIQGRQRGTMIGTEGYAPPEQYRGIADVRGDIYALGATLHHLATNADPRLETPFTFHERPIRSLNPRISEELSAVVMKMLAYNPSERYQDVHDLQSDLLAVRQRSTKPPSLAEPIIIPPPVPVKEVPPPLEPPVEAPPAVDLDRRAVSRKRAARRRRPEVEFVGERLSWTVQTGDEVRGSAFFDGESFLIGSYDHHLYSLSPAGGSMRWKSRTGRGVVSRPALAGDAIVFGSEDHNVYALDRESGRTLWSFRTGMPVRSSPVAADGSIVVGSDDGWIYCLDAARGQISWRQRTWGPVRSSPVVFDDSVIVGCDDGYLYALDRQTGRVVWRSSCGGPVQSAPAIVGSRVLVASRDGTVSAFDARHGERVWQHEASAPVLASPRASGANVIVGVVDGSLVALSAEDGRVQWATRIANQITSTCELGEGRGYVGTVDGDMVCFATESGEVIWRHRLGGSIVSTPEYGEGILVVGSTDGRICGVQLSDKEIQLFEKGT